jgi:hypothetical protein
MQVRAMFAADPSLGVFSIQAQSVAMSRRANGSIFVDRRRFSLMYISADKLPQSLLDDIAAAVRQVRLHVAVVHGLVGCCYV